MCLFTQLFEIGKFFIIFLLVFYKCFVIVCLPDGAKIEMFLEYAKYFNNNSKAGSS